MFKDFYPVNISNRLTERVVHRQILRHNSIKFIIQNTQHLTITELLKEGCKIIFVRYCLP